MDKMPCSATVAEREYDGGNYGMTEAEVAAHNERLDRERRERIEWSAWAIRRDAAGTGYGSKLVLTQLQQQITEDDRNWEDLRPIIIAACQRDEREVGRLMVELVERMSEQLAGE